MKKGFYTTLAAFMLAFSLNAQTPTAPSVSAPQAAEKRTIVREMEKTINGKQWILTLKNDEVADVKMNGKTLAKKDWTKHQSEIDDLRASAYALDTDEKDAPNEKKVIRTKDIQIDGGDLTSEQKATQHAIEESLLSDGLIKSVTYSLFLSDKTMTLNGKTMSKETTDKYIAIYFASSGEQKCEGCTFKFQINKDEKK